MSRLNSDLVLAYAKKQNAVFTTDDVAKQFKTSTKHAAAAIAILRIKSLLNRIHVENEESSSWIYVGAPQPKQTKSAAVKKSPAVKAWETRRKNAK